MLEHCANKGTCTGCKACANVCPAGCIKFEIDEEGFSYPQIDAEKCYRCGLCEMICDSRPKAGIRDFSVVSYAAYVLDEEVLKYSSSGGIFYLLASDVFAQGGIVYGAMLEHLCVKHTRVDSIENLYLIQKSKYLQSDIGDTYMQAKDDLECGRVVLFSGTPCQISGLYAFLKKDYENLLTCDVVCHGVPSKRVFELFLRYREKEQKKKMVGMLWRDKRNGWHKNSIVEVYEDGTEVATQSYYHPFQRGFLDNLYLRPSCYECESCGFPRVADISLADYWQAERHHEKMANENADKGMSIVIISSMKGESAFLRVKEHCIWEPLTVDAIKECSRHSYLPPEKNSRRNAFFVAINNRSFKKIMKEYIFVDEKKDKFEIRIKRFVKTGLLRLLNR